MNLIQKERMPNIIMEKFVAFLRRYSTTQILLMGYLTVILLGTVLLCLPISIKEGEPNVLTAFFTATSATCVTGLIRADTFLHWTFFGQLVVICLIQIGGIGFMTFCILLFSIAGKKIGLLPRSLMQNAISAPQLGGIVRLSRFLFLGSLLLEGIGALLLSFYFIPKYGLGQGIWFSIFHSISAFCNAGFDLMGGQSGAFSSLTSEVGNWYLNLIIMSLIVIGGLGFFVWRDMLDARFHLRKTHLQTKLVLFVTFCLIFGGAFILFLLEVGGPIYSQMPLDEQILSSLFQSVTYRTAGFNTIPLNEMTDSSKFLGVVLMIIGGSAGSTAGGIKTTTFAVLVLSIVSIFRHRKQVEVFGRRFEDGITRSASCIFMLYLFLLIGSTMFISRFEGLPIIDVLFETASAVATVGVTTGITPSLHPISALILSCLMIFGRAGSLTFLLAFSSNKPPASSALPLEKVQIG